MVAKGEGEWWRGAGEFGFSRYKLVYTRWINNKVLLYNSENYIQYPLIIHNGEEFEKNVSICITQSLCPTAEVNPTL